MGESKEKRNRVRRDRSFIRWSGPYVVKSLADGKIQIEPDWPAFDRWNEMDGGGPGLMSRLYLAECIANELNRIGKKRGA